MAPRAARPVGTRETPSPHLAPPPTSRAQLESQALTLLLLGALHLPPSPPHPPVFTHSAWGEDRAQRPHPSQASSEHLQVHSGLHCVGSVSVPQTGACASECAGDMRKGMLGLELDLDLAGLKAVAQKRHSLMFPSIPGQRGAHVRLEPQRAAVSSPTKGPG